MFDFYFQYNYGIDSTVTYSLRTNNIFRFCAKCNRESSDSLIIFNERWEISKYNLSLKDKFTIESYHAAIRTAALVKNEDPPEIANETSLEI